MSIFHDRFLPELKAREGGAKFTNHPADRGGPTKYGVTAAKLGEFRRLGRAATAEEVRGLTEEEADRIYTQDFWTGPGYDRIEPLSPRIAEELLDTGVNMGVGIPGRWLQRSLNVLNRQGRDYRDIAVDNLIGSGTTGALKSLIRVRGQRVAEDCVLKILNGLQVARYIEITERRQANEQFMVGWLSHRVGLDA